MPTNPETETKQTEPTDENEGEGSRSAARHYNEAVMETVRSGKVDELAEEAKEALDGPEADELRRAEDEAKRHAADQH